VFLEVKHGLDLGGDLAGYFLVVTISADQLFALFAP